MLLRRYDIKAILRYTYCKVYQNIAMNYIATRQFYRNTKVIQFVSHILINRSTKFVCICKFASEKLRNTNLWRTHTSILSAAVDKSVRRFRTTQRIMNTWLLGSKEIRKRPRADDAAAFVWHQKETFLRAPAHKVILLLPSTTSVNMVFDSAFTIMPAWTQNRGNG